MRVNGKQLPLNAWSSLNLSELFVAIVVTFSCLSWGSSPRLIHLLLLSHLLVAGLIFIQISSLILGVLWLLVHCPQLPINIRALLLTAKFMKQRHLLIFFRVIAFLNPMQLSCSIFPFIIIIILLFLPLHQVLPDGIHELFILGHLLKRALNTFKYQQIWEGRAQHQEIS